MGTIFRSNTPPTFNNFVRIPRDIWCLEGLEKDRKESLLRAMPFNQIVDRIVEEATILSHARKRSCKDPQFFRAHIILKLSPSTVDLFHNCSTGYRAQYYHSVRNGQRANTYALYKLIPRVNKLVADRLKRTCLWWWVEKSLLHPEAKVWVHQGLWLHHAKRTDRHLFVAKWVMQQASANKGERKKAKYATLTPDRETRIDIKGGFLTLDGERPSNLYKPARAKDIHKFGFT